MVHQVLTNIQAGCIVMYMNKKRVSWAKKSAGDYRGFALRDDGPRYYSTSKWEDGWSLSSERRILGLYPTLSAVKSAAEADVQQDA